MRHKRAGEEFPFLFGGTFIEARASPTFYCGAEQFPFLLGRAFIEVTLPATMIRMMLISLLSSGDLHRGDSRAKRPASIARHFSVSQRRLSLRYLGRRCNSDHRLQFPIFS